MTSCRIELAGETVELLPERALWWPARAMLLVADLHLGKAASFRALGQPVPGGTTLENLRRLDSLIARHAPREIVFLGDFLHAARSRTASLLSAVEAWRGAHPALACTLVRGNHDARAGDPPAALRIRVVDEPLSIGPFAACHEPPGRSEGEYRSAAARRSSSEPPGRPEGEYRSAAARRAPGQVVLAGHLHPVCSLYGRGRDSLRMPCFVEEPGLLVLPAFGEFTGGWRVERAPKRKFYGIAGDTVWRL